MDRHYFTFTQPTGIFYVNGGARKMDRAESGINLWGSLLLRGAQTFSRIFPSPRV